LRFERELIRIPVAGYVQTWELLPQLPHGAIRACANRCSADGISRQWIVGNSRGRGRRPMVSTWKALALPRRWPSGPSAEELPVDEVETFDLAVGYAARSGRERCESSLLAACRMARRPHRRHRETMKPVVSRTETARAFRRCTCGRGILRRCRGPRRSGQDGCFHCAQLHLSSESDHRGMRFATRPKEDAFSRSGAPTRRLQ